MVVRSELEKLGLEYGNVKIGEENILVSVMANLISEDTGTTIEQFYLRHKIEKVKEL